MDVGFRCNIIRIRIIYAYCVYLRPGSLGVMDGQVTGGKPLRSACLQQSSQEGSAMSVDERETRFFDAVHNTDDRGVQQIN